MMDTEHWLQKIATQYPEEKNPLLRQAVALAQLTGSDRASPTGQSCLQQGLHVAEVLRTLSVDQETLAAAILYHCARYAGLTIEDITEHLNSSIAKLVVGAEKMDVLHTFSESSNRSFLHKSTDNVRKMLLAMVDDVRIVLIKLAERLVILRHISYLSDAEKKHEAKITQTIYAPLANRLGIGQLKWELEDLSFKYLEPDTYRHIDSALNSTRTEQENYVQDVVALLKKELETLGIADAVVSGRAKHIYSIYRKMSRKHVDFSEIYDVRAFRLMLNTIEDCYAVLGHVHSLWEPIPKEFDDYVSKPKSNGYRSIHTAVVGPKDKVIEIQIRTFNMHEQAELGVAAHWVYKEGKPIKTGYEAKINWLRQVMDWQLEVTQSDQPTQQVYANLFDEHIYVFTPQGAVIELVKGATPLDFAYHIHTSLGHRCRGVRVNSQMVPLTHMLKTGDRVEILAAKEENPSRDWIMPSLGYLKTARAKSKVLHWFRLKNSDEHLTHGQALLDKELKRLGLKDIDYEKIASKLHFSSETEFLVALGRGDTTLTAVINAIHSIIEPEKIEASVIPVSVKKAKRTGTDIEILGVGNLLTHMAVCCKPVPGDPIIGYVTQGHGVSVHREDCSNLLHMKNTEIQNARLIQVSWGEKTDQYYQVDLAVDAYDRSGLIRDLTQILLSENISVVGSGCVTDKNTHTAHMTFSIEVSSLHPVSRILSRMAQVSNVIDARRV